MKEIILSIISGFKIGIDGIIGIKLLNHLGDCMMEFREK